ncbi:MAG: polysaccharide biosynthesis C-terminal domain-containing protein [Clostridiales bacterium]|nr:polysaccharide biosynthesis C-terminal domain-containing protein [Clostridiales bacterium]
MQEKSLTEGPIGRSLLGFALPVVLSMLAAQCYTLADTMIVGLKLDANALAAVSNASTLLMCFLFLSGGMELGGNLLVAARKPVSTKEELTGVVYNLLFVDAVIGLVMLALGLAAFRPLLLLINTPEEIVAQALLYGSIYLIGLPFQMVYDLSRQILIGCGDSKLPLYLVLFTSALNIGLDLVLVAWLGVAGAALASALAQLTGCAGVLLWLRRSVLTSGFRRSMLKVSYMKEIGRLAPPNTLQQMSGAIVSVLKQSLLGGLGVAAIAGFSCASKVSTFLMISVYGTAQALVTFIAQNAALGRTERIRVGIRTAYRILFVLTGGLVLLCVLLNRPILRLFSGDSQVVAYGSALLTFEAPSYLFAVVRHVQEARLRGRQRMLLYLVSSISTMAVNVAACMLLVPRAGYAGFYLATYISTAWSVALSVLLVRRAGA